MLKFAVLKFINEVKSLVQYEKINTKYNDSIGNAFIYTLAIECSNGGCSGSDGFH